MIPPSKLERYLAVETIGGASWHPTKHDLAYTSNLTGTFQIYKSSIVDGKDVLPLRITSEEDRCTDPRYLSDSSILFNRDRGGDENFQLGLFKSDELVWLTSDYDVKYRLNIITDEYLYFLSNLEDRSRLDLYRQKIPIRDWEPDLLLRPDSGIQTARLASPDHNSLIIRKYRGNADQDLILLDLQSDTLQNLTSKLCKGNPTRWDVVRWIDDETLLVLTDHNSDLFRPAALSANGDFKAYDQIENLIKWDVEEVAWDKSIDSTYLALNEEGYTSLYSAHFKRDGIDEFNELKLPFKGALTFGDARSFSYGMKLSPNGGYLALTLSSPTNPTSVWIYNLQERKIWQNVINNTIGLDVKDFRDCSLHRINSFDGLSVPYFKYLPEGQSPSNGWPTIMMIHGGPESQILPNFNPVIQFFLSAKFAIITPNIRGSTGYGKTYLNLDNVEKRLDSIKDIKEIALSLKNSDKDIDGDRLVIYGGSYGGFAVLSALTEHPALWKAAVDIVGISNFVTFLQNTASWRRSVREAEYGSLEQDLDTLRRISPIHKVDEIQAPLFIIQGDNDERVPLSESIQIYESVKKKGIDTKLLRYADEGHGLAKLENRIHAYTEVLNWLLKIV